MKDAIYTALGVLAILAVLAWAQGSDADQAEQSLAWAQGYQAGYQRAKTDMADTVGDAYRAGLRDAVAQGGL